MSTLYENKEIREEAQSLVNAYIHHRANELADHALSGSHDIEGQDNFAESMIRYDYDSAAQNWLFELRSNAEDLAEWLEDNEMSAQELVDWVHESPEDVCADEGLDPDMIDIFEFYAVDTWFANRLREMGEAIGELFDFTIWGRATTGQSVSMDYVILRLAENNVNARKG